MYLLDHAVARVVTIVVTTLLFWGAGDFAGAAVKRGEPLPEFKVITLQGTPVSNVSLKGSVVLIDFWATWCPPCRESLPFLQSLYTRYSRQGVTILGISVDDGGEKQVRQFLQQSGMHYPVAMGSASIMQQFGIRAVPVVFLVDRHGVVREQFYGFSPQAGRVIEQQVQRLLQER